MGSLVGILSLLLALAATSSALSCTQCVSASTFCWGASKSCPLGSVCASTYTKTVAGEKTTEFFIRSCEPSSECDFNGSITLQYGNISMVTSCCDTDNCIPKTQPLPKKGTDPNGLVCRSCVSASAWCYTSDTIQCTGNETMCIFRSTKVTGSSSSIALRGCATKSMCDLGSWSQNVNNVSIEVKDVCTSGGKSVHRLILAPTIVCLLLLKVFL
ncbi:phospholipase A2 inhibitor NAI-like [Anomaloglossus baeobatrachus]|uniref:phospholipase A2 inhibitor NAI-like n=1 Tax=Anomaloglossus baeobatrachus TaxID=238106 RepID=UPI003F4FE8EF